MKNDDTGFDDNNNPGAAFNMAIAYLKRIDEILRECNYHSRTGNIDGWYNNLLALYREIYPQFTPEHITQTNSRLKEASK